MVTIFGFADDADADVVSLERTRYTEFLDKPQSVTKYRDILGRLSEYWLDCLGSRDFIADMLQHKWRDG